MGDKVYEPSQYTKYDLERRDNDDMYAASYSKHTTADAKKERYFKSHKNKSKSIKKREIGKSLDAADWEVAINDGDAERQEKKKHKSVTSDYIFSDFPDRPKIGGAGGRKRSKSRTKGGSTHRKRSTSKSSTGKHKSGGAGTRKRSTKKRGGAGTRKKKSTTGKGASGGGRKRKSSTKSHTGTGAGKSGGGGRRRSKSRK